MLFSPFSPQEMVLFFRNDVDNDLGEFLASSFRLTVSFSHSKNRCRLFPLAAFFAILLP
jgi:hypothetical protein